MKPMDESSSTTETAPAPETPEELQPSPPSRVENILLALATIGLMGTVFCAVGWYLHSQRTVQFQDLLQEDRQRLIESFLQTAGRAYTPAWFEPELAYTLHRNQELSVWDDTFTSNELGFRAPAPAKASDVFRVLFVGDSWAYGMGGSQQEAFPAQLEKLANEMLPEGHDRVEAWTLGLPGYNTFNQTSGLEIFLDRLQPDAVVLCPTRNDNDSNFFVMPDGSNKRPSGVYTDRFGHDIARMYPYRFLASYRWAERWQMAFDRIRAAELRLAEQSIPFHLFFVAVWEPAVIHDFVGRSGIEAPYLIVPQEMWSAEWRNSWDHGTPGAYTLYARMLYRSLAPQLGWPELPMDPEKDLFQAQIFPRLPDGDWRQVAAETLVEWSERVETRFQPGSTSERLCLGEIDCRNGFMGRKAAILLRRKPGVETLRVKIAPLDDPTYLYPLELRASIPTAAGGTSTTIEVSGTARQSFALALPPESELPPGEVLELELRASAATMAPDVFSLRSVSVVEVEQK